MPIDIDSTLKKALGQLRSQREQLNRQIMALETVLDGNSGSPGRAIQAVSGRPRRRRMSAAARRAVGQRMKAYWAKRKAGTQKPKAKGKTTKKK